MTVDRQLSRPAASGCYTLTRGPLLRKPHFSTNARSVQVSPNPVLRVPPPPAVETELRPCFDCLGSSNLHERSGASLPPWPQSSAVRRVHGAVLHSGTMDKRWLNSLLQTPRSRRGIIWCIYMVGFMVSCGTTVHRPCCEITLLS